MGKNLINSFDDLREAIKEAQKTRVQTNTPRKNRHERRRDTSLERRRKDGRR